MQSSSLKINSFLQVQLFYFYHKVLNVNVFCGSKSKVNFCLVCVVGSNNFVYFTLKEQGKEHWVQYAILGVIKIFVCLLMKAPTRTQSAVLTVDPCCVTIKFFKLTVLTRFFSSVVEHWSRKSGVVSSNLTGGIQYFLKIEEDGHSQVLHLVPHTDKNITHGGEGGQIEEDGHSQVLHLIPHTVKKNPGLLQFLDGTVKIRIFSFFDATVQT